MSNMWGTRIKQLRIDAGLDQEEIAGMVNMSRESVTNWENSACPPLERIIQFCEVLNIPLWKFFYLEDASPITLSERQKETLQVFDKLPPEISKKVLDLAVSLHLYFIEQKRQ